MLLSYRSGKNTPGASAIDRQALFDCGKVVVAVDGLTIRQEAFCMEYAKSGNATRAYKQAGYKVKSDGAAGVNANRLLKNAKVQARLRSICDEIASEAIMQPKEMQEWLTKVVRGEEREMSGESSLLRDRLKAADLLGKMQGAFLDRKEVEMKGVVPVVLKDDI